MTFTVLGQRTPDTRFRFIEATAGDLHLLRPSKSIGYAPQFTPTDISSFVLTGGGLTPGSSHYVVRFYSMRVAAKQERG